MAYNADDNWVYETEPLGMGDPIRVALSHLQRNLEAFLFDKRDPGYGNPDFLSWALEHSKVTAASSGTLSNMALRWDPSYADTESIEADPSQSDNANKFYDGTIHARKVEFSTGASGPEPLDFEGETIVTRPEYARLVNTEPRVVTEYADAPAVEAEGSSVPGVPYTADESQDPTQAPDGERPDPAPLGSDPVEDDRDASEDLREDEDEQHDDVIETPHDEYQPVEHDEDKE